MQSVKTTLAAACAATLFTLPLVAADLTIVFRTVNDGQESSATEYFTTNKMRSTSDKSDTIMDTATGRLVMIDNQKKEYSEMTVAEMEAAMKGMSAQMATARQKQAEAMKSMPPALREKMQKMMPGGPGGLTITVGTGTRKVAGYDTQPYVMSMGDAMRTELWTTTALQVPLQPGELLRLQTLISPMAKDMASSVEEFKKIQGFTLASTTTVKILTKTMQSTREAMQIKTGSIPASTFEVPAGYKKVESPLAKMAQQGR